MATKQKLKRERIGAILHKHNLKRFEGFHQDNDEPSHKELLRLLRDTLKHHPDLQIFLKNPKASVYFNEHVLEEPSAPERFVTTK